MPGIDPAQRPALVESAGRRHQRYTRVRIRLHPVPADQCISMYFSYWDVYLILNVYISYWYVYLCIYHISMYIYVYLISLCISHISMYISYKYVYLCMCLLMHVLLNLSLSLYSTLLSSLSALISSRHTRTLERSMYMLTDVCASQLLCPSLSFSSLFFCANTTV